MKYTLLLSLIIALAIVSCKKKEIPVDNDSPENLPHRIEFDNPRIGDISIYAGFTLKVYSNDNYDFEYNGDTLILEIIGKEGDRYKIGERYISDDPHIPEKQNIIYYVRFNDNKIEFENISNFSFSEMFPVENDLEVFYSLFTLEDIDTPVFELDFNEMYEGPYSDTTGVVKNKSILDKNYSKLTYTQIVHPSYVDAPTNHWLYSKETGVVRKYSFNPWIQTITGWDLIPDK